MDSIDQLTQTITELEAAIMRLTAQLGAAALDDPARAERIEADIAAAEARLVVARRRMAAAETEKAERDRRDRAEANRVARIALEADACEQRAVWLTHSAAIVEAETKVTELRRARAAAIDQDEQESRLHRLRSKGVSIENRLPEHCRDAALIKQEAERLTAYAAMLRSTIDTAPVIAEQEQRAEAKAEEAVTA